jgi:AAA15 family ATPase/GTPase
MKIKSLEVEGFRSLKDFNVPEFEDTTVFYGENNAGKSNVLNILSSIFVRKSKLDNYKLTDKENFYEGVIDGFSNNFFNNRYDNPIDFKVIVSTEKGQLSFDTEISKLDDKDQHEITIAGKFNSVDGYPDLAEIVVNSISLDSKPIYQNNISAVTYFPGIAKPKTSPASLEAAFTKLMDPLNDCIYIIGSDRDMHDVAFETSADRTITAKNFKQFLHSLYLSTKEHHIFEEIDNVFASEPFNFGSISFAKDKNGLEIMIKKNNVRLPIKHIGSGVLQTLFILTSIIYQKKKIVCIEELEQNLSPKKQIQALKKIKQIIKESKGKLTSLDQIILSSHSSVYAKPKIGAIYVLEKEEDITVISKKITKDFNNELSKHLAASHPSFPAEEYLDSDAWTDDKFKEMVEFVEKEHDLK